MRLRHLWIGLISSLGFVSAAMASDYGCTVLLCLANPAGPKAVAACVAPITQLFKDLSRGKGFPTCALATAPGRLDGSSWAEQKVTFYDPCPTGTRALETDALAIQGTSAPAPTNSIRPATNAAVYRGIGEGDGVGYNFDEGRPQALPRKVCVGAPVAETRLLLQDSDNGYFAQASVFDHIVLLDPHASPNVIDVYVNDTMFQRVRW